MAGIKYLLSKTGLFPKLEPQVADVLKAAFRAHEIKIVAKSNGRRYYYVVPFDYNVGHIRDMVGVFRSNGVWLHPCKNPDGGVIAFRVRDRGQEFMRDVMRVNENANNFQAVLAERHARAQKNTVFKQLFGKFEK